MIGETNMQKSIMPDYSQLTNIISGKNCTNASPYSYTITADGYLFVTFGKSTSSGDGYIDINNKRVGETIQYSGYFSHFTFLVNKGDVIKFYGESGFTFHIRNAWFAPLKR